jgi:hypothetical protein
VRSPLLALALLLAAVTTATGQQLPCVFARADQVNARVQATVTPSPSGHSYDYVLKNQPPAGQAIVSFAVQTLAGEDTPVAQKSPSAWEAGGRIASSAFYVWDTFGQPRGLGPGASATGFGFTNAPGLPGIVTFLAWNHVESPTFQTGEAPDSCAGSDIIQNSFKGTTLGPKTPPQAFVPIEFLNYLITLLHDSRTLGWVRSDKEEKKLLQILLKAKRRLEANRPAQAAKRIKRFLDEVREERSLTSEAYALLFYNGRFLLDRLPQPPSGREDDDEDD